MIVCVQIFLKKSVLDPVGQTITHHLQTIGHNEIASTRVGKLIHLDINADTQKEAETIAHKACTDLLVNSVIEEYIVSLV